MSYPTKEEVVTALQSEGFIKTENSNASCQRNHCEVWVHNNEVVEIGIMGLDGGCSVGWINSISFVVGYRGVLQWLREKK